MLFNGGTRIALSCLQTGNITSTDGVQRSRRLQTEIDLMPRSEKKVLKGFIT
jgi:hypothetical protein